MSARTRGKSQKQQSTIKAPLKNRMGRQQPCIVNADTVSLGRTDADPALRKDQFNRSFMANNQTHTESYQVARLHQRQRRSIFRRSLIP